jgi:hypothetical protein
MFEQPYHRADAFEHEAAARGSEAALGGVGVSFSDTAAAVAEIDKQRVKAAKRLVASPQTPFVSSEVERRRH